MITVVSNKKCKVRYTCPASAIDANFVKVVKLRALIPFVNLPIYRCFLHVSHFAQTVMRSYAWVTHMAKNLKLIGYLSHFCLMLVIFMSQNT